MSKNVEANPAAPKPAVVDNTEAKPAPRKAAKATKKKMAGGVTLVQYT